MKQILSGERHSGWLKISGMRSLPLPTARVEFILPPEKLRSIFASHKSDPYTNDMSRYAVSWLICSLGPISVSTSIYRSRGIHNMVQKSKPKLNSLGYSALLSKKWGIYISKISYFLKCFCSYMSYMLKKSSGILK